MCQVIEKSGFLNEIHNKSKVQINCSWSFLCYETKSQKPEISSIYPIGQNKM